MIISSNVASTKKYYPNEQELIQDIVDGYKKVIKDVYAVGCRNIAFYDDRSGDFTSLQKTSKDKQVVLGLITTKSSILIR
ncbi:MAG: hypothetical protein ACK5KR_03155 [Breznakia sp.]